MRAFLKRNLKTIKIIVASLLGAMVLVDVILVMLGPKDFPTFSWVVRDHRTNLIWLTFLFGGLVAKIFYNRKVNTKDSEVSGFLAFLAMVALLFALGQIMKGSAINVNAQYQFLLLVCGGILAYRVWPQYTKEAGPNEIDSTEDSLIQ